MPQDGMNVQGWFTGDQSANADGACESDSDSDSDRHSNTYAYCDGDCNFDGNAHIDAAGCHNQCGNERRKFFCYTQWLSQSAWVVDDGLFPVGHDNQLRAHHRCAD